MGTGTGTPDANEKAPGTTDSTPTEGTAPKPAPPQVNDIQKADSAAQPTSQTATTTDGQAKPADNKAASADSKQESSSKKKEKKGLRKLIPF